MILKKTASLSGTLEIMMGVFGSTNYQTKLTTETTETLDVETKSRLVMLDLKALTRPYICFEVNKVGSNLLQKTMTSLNSVKRFETTLLGRPPIQQ